MENDKTTELNDDYKAAYLKEKADKANALSRLAKLEKEAKSRMTEEQIKAEEAAEKAAETERLLKQYQEREAIANLKVSFLSKGFNELMATEAAESMHKGEFTKVIDMVCQHSEAEKDKQKARPATSSAVDAFSEKISRYNGKSRNLRGNNYEGRII